MGRNDRSMLFVTIIGLSSMKSDTGGKFQRIQ